MTDLTNFFSHIHVGYRVSSLKRNSLWLLLFFMVAATYCVNKRWTKWFAIFLIFLKSKLLKRCCLFRKITQINCYCPNTMKTSCSIGQDAGQHWRYSFGCLFLFMKNLEILLIYFLKSGKRTHENVYCNAVVYCLFLKFLFLLYKKETRALKVPT